MTDLTKFELFKDLTFLECESGSYDLHNDYSLISLKYDKDSDSLDFLFKRDTIISGASDMICLLCKSALLTKCSFTLKEGITNVNSFYRGKFQENGQLIEYSIQGQGYFYIEFEEGGKIEFFSAGFATANLKVDGYYSWVNSKTSPSSTIIDPSLIVNFAPILRSPTPIRLSRNHTVTKSVSPGPSIFLSGSTIFPEIKEDLFENLNKGR